MVRRVLFARLLLAAVVFGIALVMGAPAYADDNFDLSVAPGQVTLTAKAGWHINKDYPWKLIMGDTKLDKSKFSLTESTATVTAPSGGGKLKGAVCSKDQCVMFEKPVTVP
jgi:hypothetical protein